MIIKDVESVQKDSLLGADTALLYVEGALLPERPLSLPFSGENLVIGL